jgi:hypothetical protein
MKFKRVILILIIAVNLIKADVVKKGQVGFRFLENPVSAEAIGRGGLGLTLFRNSNAVFWNPSGLGWVENKMDFSANYTRGIADINYSAFVGAFKLGKLGFLAIDLLNMDYGEFYGTRRANNEQGFIDTEIFSPQAYSIGLSFSQKVSANFSYGVRAKYAYQDLGSAWVGKVVNEGEIDTTKIRYSLGEPALDVGATYDFLDYGIRFGAVMQNFSREIKYERDQFPLPFFVGFSVTVDLLKVFIPDSGTNSLLLGFETCHPRDFKEKVKFGAEYSYYNILILRSGYVLNYDERGFTAGLGVRLERDRFGIRFDYAYQDFGIFGGVNTFSIGFAY